MAMNFNELPAEKPESNLIRENYAIAKISSAVAGVGTGPNTKGQPCLKLTLDCRTFDGSVTAKVWETLYESDKALLRYKIRRFIEALKLQLVGEFTMNDLAKVVNGKELIVALKVEQNPGYAPRNVVDVFDDNIFYPMSELGTLSGATEEPDGTPVFNAQDAEPDDETPFDMNGDETY